MTSIYDVAKAAGTSIATVSYVINKSNRIGQATTERVLQAMKELNYEPRASAQALARGRTLTITLVAPMTVYQHQASFYNIINGIGSVLSDTDYRLYIHPTLNRPGSLLELESAIRSHQMDGVILMHMTSEDPRVALLRQNKIPFVLIGRCDNCEDLSWVDADVDGVTDTCIKYLLSKGHQKIGMLAERGEANISDLLRRGFKRSILQNGLNFNQENCIEFSDDPVEINTAIINCLGKPDAPTAFFAVSDLAVLSLYNVASKLKLRIPEDISVIGYADSPIYPFMSPPCSSVFGSVFDLGKFSAEILMTNLIGEETSQRQMLIPPHLIERTSTTLQP